MESTKKSKKVEHFAVSAELDDFDRFLISQLVSRPYLTNRELAKETGKNEVTIGRRLMNPKVQEAIRELSRPALEIVVKAKNRAARRLVRCIDSVDENVALKACSLILKDVLECSEGAEATKHPIRSLIESMTDEDMDAVIEHYRDRKTDN